LKGEGKTTGGGQGTQRHEKKAWGGGKRREEPGEIAVSTAGGQRILLQQPFHCMRGARKGGNQKNQKHNTKKPQKNTPNQPPKNQTQPPKTKKNTHNGKGRDKNTKEYRGKEGDHNGQKEGWAKFGKPFWTLYYQVFPGAKGKKRDLSERGPMG